MWHRPLLSVLLIEYANGSKIPNTLKTGSRCSRYRMTFYRLAQC
jgi:hypothetical protein